MIFQQLRTGEVVVMEDEDEEGHRRLRRTSHPHYPWTPPVDAHAHHPLSSPPPPPPPPHPPAFRTPPNRIEVLRHRPLPPPPPPPPPYAVPPNEDMEDAFHHRRDVWDRVAFLDERTTHAPPPPYHRRVNPSPEILNERARFREHLSNISEVEEEEEEGAPFNTADEGTYEMWKAQQRQRRRHQQPQLLQQQQLQRLDQPWESNTDFFHQNQHNHHPRHHQTMDAEHQQQRPWRRRASDGVDSSRARMDNDWGQRASKKRQPVHRRLALLQDSIGTDGERDIEAANNVHYERHGSDGHMEHSASPSSSHTPIKVAGHGTYQQLQRKRMKPSILSRIQYNSLPLPSTPPNSQSPCKPIDGDISNASQKGKDYPMFPSSSGGEDGLDGAVELDVSFRSDSLVAKEILDSSGPSDKQDSSLAATVNGGLVRPNNTPAHTENRLTGKKSPGGPSQGPNLSSPSSGGKAKVPVKKVIKKLVKRKRIVKKMVPRSKACGGPTNSQASSHGTVIHNDSTSPLVHERNSSLPEELVVPDSALPVVATNHTSPPILSCLQGITAVQTPGGLEPEESFEIAATHGAHSSGDDNLKDEPTVMPEENIALQVHLNVALAESNKEPILLSSYGNLSPANQSGINEQVGLPSTTTTCCDEASLTNVDVDNVDDVDDHDDEERRGGEKPGTDLTEDLVKPYAGRHESTAFSHTYGKEVEAPPFSNLDVRDTVSSQVSPLRATYVNENLGLLMDKDWSMLHVDCPPPNVESAIVPMDIKEVMGHLASDSSKNDSLEILCAVPGAEVVNAEWPSFPSSDKEAQRDYSDLDEKHLGDVLPLDASGPSLVQSEIETKSYETTTTDCTFLDKTSVLLPPQRVSSIEKYNIEVKSYETTSSDCILLDKASMPLPPQQMEPSTMDSMAKGIGLTSFRDHKTSGIPKFSAHQESLGSGPSKVPLSSNQTTRNRTWHRTGSPLPSSPTRQDSGYPLGSEVPKRSGRAQSAYVRKGNSLVRKPVSAVPLSQRSSVPVATAVHQINITKSDGLNNKSFKDNVHGVDKSAALGKSGPNPLGKTKYPILPFSSKPFTSIEDPQHCHLYGSQNTLTKTSSETFIQATERLIKPKTQEDMHMHVGPLENQPADVLAGSTETPIISDDGNPKSSNANKVIYVKRKSNQLVATPGLELRDSTGHNMKKSGYKPSTELSDKYYRRNKNQLVRNAKPSEVLIGQPTPIPSNDPCLEGQTAPKHFPPECSQSKRRDKAIEKMHKHSKSSLVWTLSGKQSYNRDHSTLKCRKVIPYLFPWKINTNWRRFLSNRASFSKKSPLSFVRNMQLVQKRGTIYTVSTGGFSLRKSGVLSIGGSSLKWSKSIEKRSKKTSEEATLAVVEAERKKKEQKGSVHVNQKKVSRISCRSACGIKLNQGERIFRVGSIRYKMDSSKRTLIRIPDDQITRSDHQQGRSGQPSFVPRRLLIGNDEYVRIGNGNQLVRDPKKLVRILASEKVRWSLHTARQRLAKKQQYCQFFIRFGKCKKDKKCPYIHDPTKVAICIKFLKGLCSNTNCRLTHEVIPERMPDCSFFLQGLCANSDCPYRHVNVNPDASVCKGFLKGYCADGDECRMKHSYCCPQYEATGKCSQGSACKLDHPKSGKNMKKKRCKVQINNAGRYFGSAMIDGGENQTVSFDKNDGGQDTDIFYNEGRFTDYIGLDASDTDDEDVKTEGLMDSFPDRVCDDFLDLQSNDIDSLIKPIRLMNKNPI